MERRRVKATRWEKAVCRMFDVAYVSGVAVLWLLIWYTAIIRL